jgi:hypothetical protein
MFLPVAVGVQQFEIVERVLTSSTAPDPMGDVPGLLFDLKALPAHVTFPSCSF